ncbi:DNA starvation/stationary phase protection protein Dps [Sphingoaurantiacus capsulatus]|uniref:DNA starvation/stationary phase protection protein Dps n=1 Tax=Sphingoaurantiacus capsulatus TaxID=1771310 RepID=A0ABV7X816_9SPHN
MSAHPLIAPSHPRQHREIAMSRLIIEDTARDKSVALLAVTLVDLIDLERRLKSAHWNVRGPRFIALHELFDRVAGEVRDAGDDVAERIVILGGFADGSVRTAASLSMLSRVDDSPGWDEAEWVSHVAEVIAEAGGRARRAIEEAAAAGDADTADLLTGLLRDLDKQLWLIEANLG